MKKIVYLAGLPRSGSTLLANVLGMHKDINATPSSPLCAIIQGMRRQWSDDSFFLAQLDNNFDVIHEKLKTSINAFMNGWHSSINEPIIIEKNRGWLFGLEWLRELDPDFKIIVTLRDLRSIYSSVEKRHRKTLFIDFPDHMEHNLVDVRANALFAEQGIVGSVLKGIQNVGDIPNIINHIYYWRFEDFMERPQEIINSLFDFLGVEKQDIDFNNIVQSTHESDSHYRMKYTHKISSILSKPKDFNDIPISPRILNEIMKRFEWYYKDFYPNLINNENSDFSQKQQQQPQVPQLQDNRDNDEIMIRKLEENIKNETK